MGTGPMGSWSQAPTAMQAARSAVQTSRCVRPSGVGGAARAEEGSAFGRGIGFGRGGGKEPPLTRSRKGSSLSREGPTRPWPAHGTVTTTFPRVCLVSTCASASAIRSSG